jgi:hypothetical protein
MATEKKKTKTTEGPSNLQKAVGGTLVDLAVAGGIGLMAAAGLPGVALIAGSVGVLNKILDASAQDQFDKLKKIIHERNKRKDPESVAANTLHYVGYSRFEAMRSVTDLGGMVFSIQYKSGKMSPWAWSGVSQNLDGISNERYVTVGKLGNFEFWKDRTKVW